MIINLIKDKINQRKSYNELINLVSELSKDNKVNKSCLEPNALEILKRVYKTKSIFINSYEYNGDLYIEVTIPKSKNKSYSLQLNIVTFIFEGIGIKEPEFDYYVSSK